MGNEYSPCRCGNDRWVFKETPSYKGGFNLCGVRSLDRTIQKRIKEKTIIENKMFDKYPDVVGIDELMEMLGIGKTLAYRLLQTHQIESRKIGRQYKIAKSKIIDYLVE
jgi:excisionase family DNA binding protein